MGLFRAVFRTALTFVLSVVLPILGNSIARAYGIHLLLIDEATIIAVGLTITFLIFIKTYTDKQLRFKGLVGIIIVSIEIWYFLLFLEMVSQVYLPELNTNITVQYMGGLAEVPSHLSAVASGLFASTSVDFPVLGDLILLSFGLVFLREVLLMVEGRRTRTNEEEDRPSESEEREEPSPQSERSTTY